MSLLHRRPVRAVPYPGVAALRKQLGLEALRGALVATADLAARADGVAVWVRSVSNPGSAGVS